MPTADPDIYEGSLHREAERGVKTVAFKVPGGRPDEICVIPQHLPFVNYRGKAGAGDISDEEKLAGYDFYKIGAAELGVIAPLPKRSSTSAAVDVYEFPAGTTRPDDLTASYCAGVEKSGKCVAKFKQTDNKFTTTSTAAILGYYHVARALGDICEIKPAVLRTMDIEQHKKVVRLASEMGVHGTIAKSWSLFNQYYANPQGSGVASELFTSDFTQIYGALLENTTGEENYAEWLSAGSSLSSTRAFQHMADSRPAAEIVGSRDFTQGNVQALVAMRDMSEMILLDYLLAQSDRLTGGNISDYSFAYYLEGGKVKSTKGSKASSIPARDPDSPREETHHQRHGRRIAEQQCVRAKGIPIADSPPASEQYDCLQTLAQNWSADPTLKQFFHRECTFSQSQLARFEKYLLNAASTLRSHKESGALRLDLDLDDYFASSTTPIPAESSQISNSVGSWTSGANNLQADVKTVQRLLTAAAQKLQAPEIDPRGIDGLISKLPGKSNTVNAILAFQTRSNIPADGLIGPGNPSWDALLKAAGENSFSL